MPCVALTLRELRSCLGLEEGFDLAGVFGEVSTRAALLAACQRGSALVGKRLWPGSDIVRCFGLRPRWKWAARELVALVTCEDFGIGDTWILLSDYFSSKTWAGRFGSDDLKEDV